MEGPVPFFLGEGPTAKLLSKDEARRIAAKSPSCRSFAPSIKPAAAVVVFHSNPKPFHEPNSSSSCVRAQIEFLGFLRPSKNICYELTSGSRSRNVLRLSTGTIPCELRGSGCCGSRASQAFHF
jgi:hypothetical protein